MKRIVTIAAGLFLVAGCAPFEHGHYASDVAHQNTVGDPAGTPLVYEGSLSSFSVAGLFDGIWGSSDHTHQTANLHTQSTALPVPASQSFFPVPQTVPLQNTLVSPVSQTAYTVQQPVTRYVSQDFGAQPVQQFTSQPVYQTSPFPAQQVIQAPSVPQSFPAQQSFGAPAPIVTDVQVVPAAQSFFTPASTDIQVLPATQNFYTPAPAVQSHILATSHGQPHQVDANGYLICNHSLQQHAAHQASQFHGQSVPRF